jgi:hypothetical protein
MAFRQSFNFLVTAGVMRGFRTREVWNSASGV